MLPSQGGNIIMSSKGTLFDVAHFIWLHVSFEKLVELLEGSIHGWGS
jgi:hypothetical protein